MINRESIMVLIGAAIACIAQIIIAPNIAIFSAMPNFILAYVLVVAIVRPRPSVYVLAFVLGLVYDLIGYGPVGLMAFLLVLAAFATSRAFVVLNNDTLFMPITIFVVAAFAVELLYGVFMLGFGVAASPVEALVYRALPCALYDCVFGLIFYPIALRILAPAGLGTKVPSRKVSVHASSLPRTKVKKSSGKTRRR